MKANEVLDNNQNIEDEPTREEMFSWYDSEIAETVLFINDELPGGEGLDYIKRKTQEFTEMIRQDKKSELEDIWRP